MNVLALIFWCIAWLLYAIGNASEKTLQPYLLGSALTFAIISSLGMVK